MVQSYKTDRTFRVGPVLSFSKYFGPDKTFYSIKSNEFFLSWHRFVVLTAVTSVSEVIAIFLKIILFGNTAAFFYSLLGLVPRCFFEKAIAVRKLACVEKINRSRDSWLVLRGLQASSSYL